MPDSQAEHSRSRRRKPSRTGERVAENESRDVLTRILIANDGEVLARLRLSAAEAARVCNVTPRQLIYWTKKGLVKSSTDGDHDYDVYAMEKVIRIRQSLEKGYALEAEAKRHDELAPDALEDELRGRLERLESRVGELRRSLPASLTIARLRRAVGLLARLDAQGSLDSSHANGETAKAVALRLGRAIDELELLLREVQATGA